MNEITRKYVRSLFDYRDGGLYWKVSRGGVKITVPAGTVNNDGYRHIQIDGKIYKAHRLIFLYHHDYLPEFLDHIDGDKLNNGISNLREATKSQNQRNRKKQASRNGKLTSSKFKGVDWYKHHEKWRSRIKINGKSKHLGYFISEIEAALTYDEAAIERDGKFALTNAMMYPKSLRLTTKRFISFEVNLHNIE